MNEIILLIALNIPSLTFQNYDGYIYPEEKSGEFLEGPLSSEWVEEESQEEEEQKE